MDLFTTANFVFDLQLFGEDAGGMGDASAAVGSDGSSGDAATTTPAETAQTDGVATGGSAQQAAPATANDEGAETFESLIAGKYKKDYNAKVNATVKDRLRKSAAATQELQGRINAIDPIVRMIAGKYGIAPGQDGAIDIAALEAKMNADDSLLEQEAFQRGMSVDNLRQIKQIEQREQSLQQREAQAKQQYQWQQIADEGESLKQVYDNFDMDAEMSDPQFARMVATLMNSGFPNPVRTAYESIHRDTIMQNMMQYAVQQTKSDVAKSIASGQSRPKENGTGSQSAGTASVDPSKLTKEQINDYIARSRRGEHITFR